MWTDAKASPKVCFRVSNQRAMKYAEMNVVLIKIR